jgi:two-component system LytT family response regulator
MKTILIDDEPPALRLLVQMLQKVAPQCTIAATCSNLKEGVAAIQNLQPELVFLDIEMPRQKGIEIAEWFNGELPFQVIFVTAYPQYAADAFGLNATDYLLKPLTEEKLIAALRKAEQKRSLHQLENQLTPTPTQTSTALKKILLPVANGFEILSPDNINFLKAEGSYTVIHFTDEKTLMASKNLKYFEQLLTGHTSFIRVHRSYVANLDKARKILNEGGTELLFENGARIPIATDRVERIMAALMQG